MPQNDFIYMDHNATTPLAPEAVEAMGPYLSEEFGNPSSGYGLGRRAKEGVDTARKQVADLLGCEPREVVFTSGGTESNNMVLKGFVAGEMPRDCHIITSAVEHPAILNPTLFLLEKGVGVTILPVDRYGLVDPDAVSRAMDGRKTLVSVMLANNETGTLQPVEEIARKAREKGALVHTDAAQAVGKMPLNVKTLGVDFLSVAGHKLYGPKGVGALFLRSGLSLTPLMHGAGQEQGQRAGTENVLLIVGLGAACQVARERLVGDVVQIKAMRDRLQDLLLQGLPDLVVNGHPERRLPNTLHVSIPGLEGARILAGVPPILASTGAACHDRSVSLSHVLAAMGIPKEQGMGALRLTLGRLNTLEQVEETARKLVQRVQEMRHEIL